MKKRWFISCVLLLSFVGAVRSQVIKVENGVSISAINIGDSGYDDSIYPYQMSIGIDYLDRGWYELSSNIGYLRKGSDVGFLGYSLIEGAETIEIGYRLDYITANTTFRVKAITHTNFAFYAGVGPRIDIKIKDDLKAKGFPKWEGDMEKIDINTRSLILGLKTEVGVNYFFDRYLVGVNCSYLPSFTRPAKGGLKERTFTAGIVVDYVL